VSVCLKQSIRQLPWGSRLGRELHKKVISGIHNNKTTITLHCKEDPIYVFSELKLRSLVPNFHIHVSESDLYFPHDQSFFLLQKIG
jgi:hypothetical protein